MSDSDVIFDGNQKFDGNNSTSQKHDDFCGIFTDIVGHVQFKFLGFMFVIFMLLSTDTFINRVLGVFGGAVTSGIPTSYGTTLQGLFLILAMLLIDPLIRLGLI